MEEVGYKDAENSCQLKRAKRFSVMKKLQGDGIKIPGR